MEPPMVKHNRSECHDSSAPPLVTRRWIAPLIIVFLWFTLLASLLTAVIILQHCNVQSPSSRPPLVLISLDGFRHDYLEKVRASGDKVDNFDYLIRTGVRAMESRNVFPTVTLSNHQTLLTGLYPENNGVVHNSYYDPKLPRKLFDINNQTTLNDAEWFMDWPEPIWVTCQRAGCLTASVLWPLTDAPILKDLPFQQESQYFTLNEPETRYPYDKRIDDVIRWLTNPRYHIDMVLVYFDEPDATGHSYGPNSNKVIDAVRMLDGYVGYMIERMKDVGIFDQVDMIITADHGMSEISDDRVIDLDQYVNSSFYYYTRLSPVGAIYPKPGHENYVYHGLLGVHEHLHVWWRKDVPPYLCYNLDNGRIAPIILLADNGWSIVTNFSKPNVTSVRGNHGYNDSEPDIHPFLIAHGPSFKVNYTTPLVHMLDIYPLMCSLLGIRPNPNNGSLDRIAHLLKSTVPLENYRRSSPQAVWVWIGILAVLLLLFSLLIVYLLVIYCRRGRARKQQLDGLVHE